MAQKMVVSWLFVALSSVALPADSPAVSPPESFRDLVTAATGAAETQDWEKALPLWRAVVGRNPVNDEFQNYYAYALYFAGQYEAALPVFERVLELRGDRDHNSAYNLASVHMKLQQTDKALHWLERALELGLPEFQVVLDDADFDPLRDHPRFRKLMALLDDDVSREEGWRHDLRLMRREVKRIGYAPFRSMTEKEFDARIDSLIRNVPRLSDDRIRVECMKIMRDVGDGHSSFYTTFPGVPLQFYLFAEGLHVVAADPAHQELLGMEVVRFGDSTVEQVMAGIDEIQSRDNPIWLTEIGPYKMRQPRLLHALDLIPEPTRVTLTLRSSDGETREVAFDEQSEPGRIWNGIPETWKTYPESLAEPLPHYLRHPRKHFWFEHLPDGTTLYAQLNRIRDTDEESLGDFMSRLLRFAKEHEVRALVLDIRRNKGGNTRLARPLIAALHRSPTIDKPGSLYVIAGRRTFSAAQNLATLLEAETNAIFVGEPTGSSPSFVGEENTLTLPYSGAGMSISNVRWSYSTPFDKRTWIAPRIYAPPTFTTYRANRDPALEAILDDLGSHPGN